MAINQTKAERQRQLASDFANKIALERSFKRSLNSLLREINQDYFTRLMTRGQVISLSEYQTDMTGLLRQQYRRVVRRFGNQLRRQIKSFDGRELKQLDDEINQEQQEFITAESAAISALVLATTQRQLFDINQRSQAEIIEEFPEFLPGSQDFVEESAKRAATKFGLLIPSKSELIAETEVQNAAETSKYIEAKSLSDANAANVNRKQWNTILDERTRISHVSADGQFKQRDEPFLVQGERLLYPRDTSLGASVGNIARCRCSSIYIVD